MPEREPNLVTSSLSGVVTQDGVTVEVSIVKLEGTNEWTLEVVKDKRTSIVWDDPFATDDYAYAEFKRTVAEEGMSTFLDTAKVVPFKRP